MKASSLLGYCDEYPPAKPGLVHWHSIAKAASWSSINDIVRTAGFSPSPVGSERVVFNIGGNNYRLVCSVWFFGDRPGGIVFIKWFGTHAEYDKIDVTTVDDFG